MNSLMTSDNYYFVKLNGSLSIWGNFDFANSLNYYSLYPALMILLVINTSLSAKSYALAGSKLLRAY